VIQSTSLAADTIQLNDGTQNLLGTLSTGAPVSYTLNGISTPIHSNSRTVTIAPGVTANLLQATSQPVTVTVSRNLDLLDNAISSFVSAYNNAVDALDKQTGEGAGFLSGQSIVYSLRNTLREISQYTGSSGAVSSLTAMGIEVDKEGHLSFDPSQLAGADSADLQAFLGGASTGGFLKAASDTLAMIEDSSSGFLKAAIQQSTNEISSQNDKIDEQTQRLYDLEDRLNAQMAAADALIASLESQRDYITNLFTVMLNNNSSGVKSK